MATPTIIFNTKLNQQGALRDAKSLRDSLGRPIDIKLNTRSLAQPLGRITGDVAEFTKSLQAATARVTAFGATSGGIIAVSQAISQVAKSVIEVDKQLIELNTFLGQSQSKLQSVGDSLFKIAKDTASSFANTAEAAKEFARQGLSVEETLKRTNDALVLSRISGLGAADSVNALTTAINSFNKSGLDSAEIVNKLVKVDSNFAVSAADLAQALTRVGSAAQDSGVGFEELIAVVTTAQQTTGRGGAIIGNALKTIFTRLKRPEVLDQLQQLGVAVKDQNGALLSGTQILTNYISATKNLGQVEKARNDELLGGVYQINQLKAITNDLAKANGIYARSLAIANSATDDATKKNQELNKSLSAIIQNTKTNFEKRGGSIGEPIIKPLVKRAAGLGNFLLDNLGVDKSSAGKEGQDLGNTFAQSFFKGIGEAASGPGLVLIGALAINIGKRLVSFVSDASKVLLNINSTAANTQAIEQAINNTLAQQPKITQAIISGQITREQAAAQLLKVFTMQNQQLMLQKGLASSLAQTFSKGGYVASPELGIYKTAKRKAGGYIPNFAAEKREAMSYGASPSVQPYMTEAVINGTPQVVTVNTGETVIPRYKGGVDTAIIPNYAKGNIPNFAGKQFNINSAAGFQKLIRSNAQKFLSIKYKTENGIVENFDASKYIAQFGPSVRKDEYVGAAPPRGFKTWQEFREATNTISIRTAGGERKTFRADRILQVNAGGNTFVPSSSLQQANNVTSPFNSKTLRGMGVENLTKVNTALAKPSFLATASFEDVMKSVGPKYKRRFASGYIPNFAAGRYMSPASRPSSRVGSAGGSPNPTESGLNQKSAFESAIGSAVTSAIYFALPSIVTGFANENNQGAISASLKAGAAVNVLAAAINGASKGGARGAITGALGASVTSGVLLSQASQVKTGVREQVFEKARDKAVNGFNKLTENISDLTQTISDLESQYADPNARPDALIKLAKKEQDLLNKISLNNPEAAALYKSAGSPEEKQRALATAKDVAQKEASISKTVLDFAELDTAKRDAKAITSFFSELAGQLDTEKVDIKNLTTSNFNDFLNRGGIGKTSSVFSGGKGGEDLTRYFIDFLKTQEKRVTLNKEAESLISEIKKPLIELQGSIESSQAVRAASREARGGYLENISRFSGNFGERAAIESKAAIDRYNLNRNEKQTFFSRVSNESKDLTSPALRSLVQSITSKGPSRDASDSIKSLIADLKKSNPQSKDIDKLQKISAQILTGIKKAGTFDKIIEAQNKFALKALTPQERLSFGGGIKTSIDASSKIDAFKNTQRGALQYQLGSMFGSRETQIGGLANFATNLKEKYAGLFEGEAGKNAFGGVADQLTQLRAFDIRQSLAKDAMTARNIGQFGLAGELESKLSPMNQGEIYKTARLQAEQQLGLTPKGLIGESLTEAERADAVERQAKASEDQQIRGVEKALAPSIDAITSSFVTQINQLQEPLNTAIQNAFGKGMEISNATLIAKNLDIGSIIGGKSTPETNEYRSAPITPEERAARKADLGLAGGFIPNFSSALSDAVSREMSAGYSASQVKVGQSNSLRASFNPQGLGVFNSTEGSLGNGMSLARNAGINPQTKGMANGFIPNFAKKSGAKGDFDSKLLIKNSKKDAELASREEEDLKRRNTKEFKQGEIQAKTSSLQEKLAQIDLDLQKTLTKLAPSSTETKPAEENVLAKKTPKKSAIEPTPLIELAASAKKTTTAKKRIKEVITEAAEKPAAKIRRTSPKAEKPIASSMAASLSLPEPEGNYERIATLKASRLLKEQQKIVSQQQLKNELILEQMEKGPFEKQYRALLREEARTKAAASPLALKFYGAQDPRAYISNPKPSIFEDTPLETFLRVSAQEAALGKGKNPLSTGGISGPIARLEKEMERRQAQLAQERQAKIEARRRSRISPTVPKFLPPADPKFIQPTTLDIEGTSPLFKKAGPGLLFTGSFGGPTQITRDLPINTTEGFNATKALLDSNPELAKTILGDNFADILKSRSAFKRWNKSQGETIVGVKNDGSSLVAKLTETQQRQADQAIKAGLAKAARAAGGGAGAGGGFGGGAGGAGGGFGGGAGGGAGGGFGGGAGGWRGAARAGSGLGGGFGSYFAANSAAAAAGNAALKNQFGLFPGFGGYSGFVSRKDLNRQAADLLKFDKTLLENKSLSPETRALAAEAYLEKLGPYGSKVRDISNQMLEKQNLQKARADIKGKFQKIFDPNTGKVTLNNRVIDPTGSDVFDSVTKEINKAISEGRLTPEQGAKLQSKIYSETFGVSPNEYVSLLKRKGTNLGSLADYLAGTDPAPNLNDQLKAKGMAEDLSLLNKKINRSAGYEIDPNTGLAVKPTTTRGPNWRSFSQYVLERTADINANPALSKVEKQEAIELLRRSRASDEYRVKRDFVKDRGFEYNPLTGEAVEKGSFAEAAKARRADKELAAATQENRFGKIGNVGLGLAGVAFGALGAYEQLKQGNYTEGVFSSIGALASLPEAVIAKNARLQSLVNKIGGRETLGKIAGGAFGIAGAIGSASQAGKEFAEGKAGQGTYSTLQGAVSGGAGLASIAGQAVIAQRLFGVGAGLGFARELYNAKDSNFQLTSGGTTKGRFLSAFTGQSFEGEVGKDEYLAAAGDLAGSAFTYGMGGIGAGVAVAKLGYRFGNFLEQEIDDFLGMSDTASKYGTKKMASQKDFETVEDYKKYLEEEKKKYSYRSESGFLSGFNPSNYLFDSNNLSAGFIPNFSALKEMSAIRNSPDYAGYRNATPMRSSVYDDKIINTAEIETPVQDVYARMFGPIGYSMKPKNPNETHAILNPAQQNALGYAAGGFVPNFSMDEFTSKITEAMKNGMGSYAGGAIPQTSNNVYLNDNRSYSEASNDVMEGVLDLLFKKYPQEMAALGPKITKFK